MRNIKKYNDHGDLLTYRQIGEKLNIGLSSAQHIAKESGALRKIGKCARVDIAVLNNYLSTQAISN